MLIAFAELTSPGDSYADNDMGVAKFHINLRVSACDGTYGHNTTFAVSLAAGATTTDINEAIFDAVETWVNGQHSWVLDRKNFYFHRFGNAS